MKRLLIIYITTGCLLQLILIRGVHLVVIGEAAYIKNLHLPHPPPDLTQISIGSTPYTYGIPVLIIAGLVLAILRNESESKFVHLLGALAISTILLVLLQIVGFLGFAMTIQPGLS